MISNTKKWLSAYYEIPEDSVETFFKNEDVTGFLIIWTIFEQKTQFSYNNIDQITGSKYHIILEELKDEFAHFHKIYQNEDRLRNLEYASKSKGKADIKSILDSPAETISNTDKLKLLFYVVFRYRNNIFHGNKPVESWKKFPTEIGYCINVMKSFLKTTKAP